MTPSSTRCGWAKSEEWETHKEKIRQLYCIRDKPLKQVMEIMETEHEFHATYVDVLPVHSIESVPPG